MQDTLTQSKTQSEEFTARGSFAQLRTAGVRGGADSVTIKGFHPVTETWIAKGSAANPATITTIGDEVRVYTVPGERLRVDLDGTPDGDTSVKVWLEHGGGAADRL